MSDLKSFVGLRSGTYTRDITETQIQKFRRTLSAEPLPFAPPTFITCCRQGEFDLFEKMGFNLSKVLHTDQEFEYEPGPDAAVLPGDTLVFESVVEKALEKKSGSGLLRFFGFETRIQVKRLERVFPVAKSWTTVIMRMETLP